MHLQAKPYAKFIFDCRELLRDTLSWNVSSFGCCYVINVFKNCYASRVSLTYKKAYVRSVVIVTQVGYQKS